MKSRLSITRYYVLQQIMLPAIQFLHLHRMHLDTLSDAGSAIPGEALGVVDAVGS